MHEFTSRREAERFANRRRNATGTGHLLPSAFHRTDLWAPFAPTARALSLVDARSDDDMWTFDPAVAGLTDRISTTYGVTPSDEAPPEVNMDAYELDGALTCLREQFPDVPADALTSILGGSYQLVVTVSGQPLVGRAEDLARLRLEVRTRHPTIRPAVASHEGAA